MADARVVAVSVGRARPLQWRGRTITTAIAKSPTDAAVFVHALGLDGDQQGDPLHHGGQDKAVLAYPSEHYAALCRIPRCRTLSRFRRKPHHRRAARIRYCPRIRLSRRHGDDSSHPTSAPLLQTRGPAWHRRHGRAHATDWTDRHLLPCPHARSSPRRRQDPSHLPTLPRHHGRRSASRRQCRPRRPRCNATAARTPRAPARDLAANATQSPENWRATPNVSTAHHHWGHRDDSSPLNIVASIWMDC